MSLLIVIPSKIEVAQYYRDRVVACSETWLKDCPCDFKLFSDADLGVSGDQYNLENDPIRTLRTKAMCKYAFDRGYDHLFRCDTDTYVWTNRLLACGFEQHDYIGYCHAIPRHVEVSAGRGLNTAHGGAGFFLSRKAMQLVVDAPVARCGDGRFWGDIYTGEVLWEHGIYCHRDLRFVEANGRHKTHDGNVFADEIPENHGCITIHPVPAANMKGVYNQFPSMSAETAPLDKQPWDIWMSYTLLCTSLERHDLLHQTLESFVKFADDVPIKTVISEDGPAPKPAWLSEAKYAALGELLWLNNDKRRGQIYCCDKLWARCDTAYAFWLEDDWEFLRPDFITPSYDILKRYSNIFTVALYEDTCFGHPTISSPLYPFKIQEPNWGADGDDGWGGFNFNPGLRRLSDYQRLGTYGKVVGYDTTGCEPERGLSRLYLVAGYRIAAVENPCVKHIGRDRSVAAVLPAVTEPPPPL